MFKIKSIKCNFIREEIPIKEKRGHGLWIICRHAFKFLVPKKENKMIGQVQTKELCKNELMMLIIENCLQVALRIPFHTHCLLGINLSLIINSVCRHFSNIKFSFVILKPNEKGDNSANPKKSLILVPPFIFTNDSYLRINTLNPIKISNSYNFKGRIKYRPPKRFMYQVRLWFTSQIKT